METFLRVAMIGWEFPPMKVGGLAVHCFHLTKELAKLGIQIDLFLPKTPVKIVPPHPNVNIIQVSDSFFSVYLGRAKFSMSDNTILQNLYCGDIPMAIARYSFLCTNIIKVLHSITPYALVHGHDWITIDACASIKSITRLPWLHTYHSTEYDRNVFPWDYITNIEAKGTKHADMIISVSERTKNTLVEKYSADPNKIRIVYNGVSHEEYDREQREEEIAKHLRGKKIVLFLGRLTQQKGPEFFLRVAKRVLEKRDDVIFIVAGKGEMLPRLINDAISLGIIRNIVFLGYIPDDLQPKIYAMADVFVMPSTSEPFGITALEAMAAGVPVIVSKTSGVSEIIKTAFKVDFWDIERMADTILGILKYPVLKKILAYYEKKEVRNFTWRKTAEDTLKVYKELLNV